MPTPISPGSRRRDWRCKGDGVTPPFQRVVVIGCSGAGKSTFARILGELTGLPVTHIDQLFWEPGWVMAPQTVYLERLGAVVERETWIIEGVNASTLDLRLPRTDLVIWLDRSRWVCLWRVARRIATSYGQVRPDMAPGCPEQIDFEFFRYIWRFHAAYDHRIQAAIDKHGLGGRTIRIRSDREAQDYLALLAVNS